MKIKEHLLALARPLSYTGPDFYGKMPKSAHIAFQEARAHVGLNSISQRVQLECHYGIRPPKTRKKQLCQVSVAGGP